MHSNKCRSHLQKENKSGNGIQPVEQNLDFSVTKFNAEKGGRPFPIQKLSQCISKRKEFNEM